MKEIVIFKCKNDRCRAPLGFSQGHVLLVGAVRFARSVTLECVVCGRGSFWTPEKREEMQTRKVA